MALIAPGIDSELLEDQNFYNEIQKYGYDRFRFNGRGGMWVDCLLWKVGEYEASITVQSPSVLYAAHHALVAARVLAESEPV